VPDSKQVSICKLANSPWKDFELDRFFIDARNITIFNFLPFSIEQFACDISKMDTFQASYTDEFDHVLTRNIDEENDNAGLVGQFLQN
jgi:hypothetical protein